jgi:hypothetical protein
MPDLQFILALLGIAAGYVKQVTANKDANAAANEFLAIDQATMAVLQENARIKGVAVDWEDPSAVAAFVQTLPTFVPLPEPIPHPTPIGPEPGKE